tara:strand:- start:455 stop:3550 length:3096 start_codon:yes stop_codon:yes gene_type:complete
MSIFFGKDITAEDLAAGRLQGSEKEKSAVSKALRFGLDQPTENVATTLRALGFDTQADTLSGLIDAPENYDSKAAQFVGEEGMYDFSALPLAVVEQAGQLGGSLLSRSIGAGAGLAVGGLPGAFIGGLLGPGLFEAVQIAGPVALERARNANPPREEPDISDWAAALGTATFSGVLNAIGAKNIGKLNTTLVGTGVREGSTEFLQGLTEQFGSTAGTDKGLELDLRQAGGEGLIGGFAGTSAQIPSSTLNTAQSLEDLRQDIIGDSITNAMFDQTTPDQAVEEMGEQLMLTEQTVQNIEQFEQEADQYDPDDPGAFTDEDIIQEFLTTNDQYLENLIETEFGNQLTRDQQFQLFVNVQDYIRNHFEFFDPRTTVSPREALAQMAQTVQQESTAFLDRANLEQVESGTDPRYVGPQSMNVNLNAKEELYNQGGAGITSIESGIDPNFLTQSILIEDGILDQRLPKDPNKLVNPQGLLQELGVKETDKNWFETSKRGSKKVVSEVVNTEIAPFLKAKKDAGEKVTRAEIENILYDSLSRHNSFYREGMETEHRGGHTFAGEGLGDLFPEVVDVDNYFELWNHYIPLIPGNSALENSPYFNRDGNDNLHNPHGDGANMWTRGFKVSHPQGLGTGKLIAENQSKLHGHSQDPNKTREMYLSSVNVVEDTTEIDNIRNRRADYDRAYNNFAEEVANKNTTDDTSVSRAMDTVATLLLEEPSQYDNYRDEALLNIDKELSSISNEYANEVKKLRTKQAKENNDAFVDIINITQPLGSIGILIDQDSFQNFMDQPAQALDVFESAGRQRRNKFIEYVLANHGVNLNLGRIEDPDTFRPIDQEILNLADRPNLTINEKHAKEKVELILDYSPKLADKYNTFNNLIIASDNYPSMAESRQLEEFEGRSREDRILYPDYPFKNNYSVMNLRRVVTKSIKDGDDFVFIGSGGKGGAPESVYKAQKKEAGNIAEVIASYQDALKAEDLFKVLPDSADVPGGPYYALDIRPLKQLIEAKVFKGFKGYKEGGLVMNYGDYGRSYI